MNGHAQYRIYHEREMNKMKRKMVEIQKNLNIALNYIAAEDQWNEFMIYRNTKHLENTE